MENQPLLAGTFIVGAKQTLKAIESQKAIAVYIARDADERVIVPIKEACLREGITAIEVDTKVKLGKDCGLAVGAATCAVLK